MNRYQIEGHITGFISGLQQVGVWLEGWYRGKPLVLSDWRFFY